jgi:hypothetical protein
MMVLTMVHCNHTAMQLATNARLLALQSNRTPALVKPATQIRSSTNVQSRRVVSIPRVEMTIVLAGLDIELMGWHQRIPSSSGWRSRDRSIGSLLRLVWAVIRFVRARSLDLRVARKYLLRARVECNLTFLGVLNIWGFKESFLYVLFRTLLSLCYFHVKQSGSSSVQLKLFTYETADGSLQLEGLGPSEIQPGDLVCIHFGCPHPVILRVYDMVSMKYSLIGKCYVHVKLEGKHFFRLDHESIKTQTSAFKIW